MSRRDTIIIAVLVNAGLLMVLFTTAIKSDKEEESFFQQKVELCGVEDSENPSQDLLLDQYVTSLSNLEEEVIFAETGDEMELMATPVEVKKEEALKPTEQYVHVTVKKGDFLEKIAKANKTTVAAILQVNQVNPTQLKVGQVLKIPISKDEKTSPTPPSRENDYYIVKEGDNPWLIASRNHINLETLLQLNGLDERKAKRLRPGDRLRIR